MYGIHSAQCRGLTPTLNKHSLAPSASGGRGRKELTIHCNSPVAPAAPTGKDCSQGPGPDPHPPEGFLWGGHGSKASCEGCRPQGHDPWSRSYLLSNGDLLPSTGRSFSDEGAAFSLTPFLLSYLTSASYRSLSSNATKPGITFLDACLCNSGLREEGEDG